MDEKHQGLMNEHCWSGEFFLPNSYEDRFHGKLRYSPEDGVWLEYMMIKNKANHLPPVSHIWGYLDNGKRCTLVGRFVPANAGFKIQSEQLTHHGNNQFDYLLVGEHVDEKEAFDSLHFEATNLHEFFSGKENKDIQKFSDQPLHKSKLDFGRIEFRNSAQFISLQDNLECHVFSHNKEALRELQSAFQSIKDKHSNARFLLKKDLGYGINMYLNNPEPPYDLLEKAYALTDLFSLLIFSPALPDKILFIKKYEGRMQKIEVYPTALISKETIQYCLEEKSHHRLPLNADNIDLGGLLAEWFKCHEGYEGIISSVQNMPILIHKHAVRSDIVLFATQLEDISYKDNQKNNKYGYPFEKYASRSLYEEVEKICKKSGHDNIQVLIADLRNEIAHMLKPKKALNDLKLRDLADISRCMQLVIISYVFKGLGMPQDAIEQYQYRLQPSRWK